MDSAIYQLCSKYKRFPHENSTGNRWVYRWLGLIIGDPRRYSERTSLSGLAIGLWLWCWNSTFERLWQEVAFGTRCGENRFLMELLFWGCLENLGCLHVELVGRHSCWAEMGASVAMAPWLLLLSSYPTRWCFPWILWLLYLEFLFWCSSYFSFILIFPSIFSQLSQWPFLLELAYLIQNQNWSFLLVFLSIIHMSIAINLVSSSLMMLNRIAFYLLLNLCSAWLYPISESPMSLKWCLKSTASLGYLSMAELSLPVSYCYFQMIPNHNLRIDFLLLVWLYRR